MSGTSEQLTAIRQRVQGLQTRLLGIQPTSVIYAAAGAYVQFGCLVTEGASASDMDIALKGLVTGDEDHHNPDVETTPTRNWQYPNTASLFDGAFLSVDTTVTVDDPPAAGLARYDIVYIYVGPTGSGVGIATGTPSSATKSDYDGNGLRTEQYNEASDPALPVGSLPVARIYVEDVFAGVADAQIADIRIFTGRLKGDTGDEGPEGPQGPSGGDGDDGWSPLFAIATDGERRVLQVSDWAGGEGTKPATGEYAGSAGLVANIADAINIRGPGGSGTGDMQSSTYDPTTVGGDAFLMANMAETASAKVLTSAERSKLGAIESGATADQTASEIETAYSSQVSVVSQSEAETGTATTVRRWTALRVGQAVAALRTFDRYDVANATTTTTLDFDVSQVFNVDASTNRTLAFNNVPGSTRAMVATVRITGDTGTITWPAGIINWSGGSAPDLSASWTAITLLWDGTNWSGFKSGGAD